MENREFVSAKDLPIAEGDEVSVLCVENGEMKRKPAKGLGGSSVLTITITKCWYEEDDREKISIEPVPTGTFEVIKKGLTDGTPPIILGLIQYEEYVGVEHYRFVLSQLADIDYGFPSENYPECIVIRLEDVFVLLPDDRIMTMDEFEQEMGGGE